MTTYQDLDWGSMDFIRQHLYKRVANPLDNALGRLLIAEHLVQEASAKAYLSRVSYGLEVSLNLLKAWAALVHVQNGKLIGQEQRRAIAHDAVPDWVQAYLSNRAPFKAAFTRPAWVHPETFYEGLVLLCDVAASVGKLKSIVLIDSPDATSGIWARAIFTPGDSGRYTSLDNLISRLDDGEDPDQRDILTQIDVLRALFAINGAELRVQDNLKTGEQALAVQFPAVSASQIATTPATPGREAHDTPAERAPDQQPAGEASEMPPTVDTALDVTADTSAAAAQSDHAVDTLLPAPSPRVLVQDHLNALDQPPAADDAPNGGEPDSTDSEDGDLDGDNIADKDDTLRVPALDWREQMLRAGYVPSSEESKFLVPSALLKRDENAPSEDDNDAHDAESDAKPAETESPRAADAEAGEGNGDADAPVS